MFKHDLKLKMAILFIVFLESWLLGALRFDWNFASFLYGVLNIPFGIGNVTQNTTGTKTNIMPNYALGWEKTASTNVGLDFSFLNNRISGSLEYYDARTSDLLMNKTIPVITGYAQILSNVGKTRNRGFEASLSTVNVQTKDFTWQTDWTFSLNKEEIVELLKQMMDYISRYH